MLEQTYMLIDQLTFHCWFPYPMFIVLMWTAEFKIGQIQIMKKWM